MEYHMGNLIEKLLVEVDPDIAEFMMRDSYVPKNYPPSNEGHIHIEKCKMWEIIQSPALTIIEWQRMRNDKKV